MKKILFICVMACMLSILCIGCNVKKAIYQDTIDSVNVSLNAQGEVVIDCVITDGGHTTMQVYCDKGDKTVNEATHCIYNDSDVSTSLTYSIDYVDSFETYTVTVKIFQDSKVISYSLDTFTLYDLAQDYQGEASQAIQDILALKDSEEAVNVTLDTQEGTIDHLDLASLKADYIINKYNVYNNDSDGQSVLSDTTKNRYLLKEDSLTGSYIMSDYLLEGMSSQNESFDKLLVINDESFVLAYQGQTAYVMLFNKYIKLYIIENINQLKVKINETLPTCVKDHYEFKGWLYNGEVVTTMPDVKDNLTLEAQYEYTYVPKSAQEICDNLGDTLNTNDMWDLQLTDDNAGNVNYTYSVDNVRLVYISGSHLSVKAQYQKHQTQSVNLTVKCLIDGVEKSSATKVIEVGATQYDDLPSTPIATYFSASSANAISTYSTRYKSEKTMFSQQSKEGLDIVYYSFARIDSQGNCSLDTSAFLNEVLELKNYGVRVLISVAGTSDTDSTYFAQLTSNEKTCKTLASNLMDLVDKYKMDGLDIDWESTYAQYVVASGMNNLTKALKEEMTKRQAQGGTAYMLTAAVPSSSWGMGADRYDFPTLNNYLDLINLMSYDANRSEYASHLAPCYSSSYDNGYGFSAVWGAEQLKSLGFDINKVLLGCAGYGKVYKDVNAGSNSKYPGLGQAGNLGALDGISNSYASGTIFGNGIHDLLNSPSYKVYHEYNSKGQFVGSYLYSVGDKVFVSYESELSIQEKYKYASQYNGMGLMCWSYGEDCYERITNAMTACKKNTI